MKFLENGSRPQPPTSRYITVIYHSLVYIKMIYSGMSCQNEIQWYISVIYLISLYMILVYVKMIYSELVIYHSGICQNDTQWISDISICYTVIYHVKMRYSDISLWYILYHCISFWYMSKWYTAIYHSGISICIWIFVSHVTHMTRKILIYDWLIIDVHICIFMSHMTHMTRNKSLYLPVAISLSHTHTRWPHTLHKHRVVSFQYAWVMSHTNDLRTTTYTCIHICQRITTHVWGGYGQ